MTDANPPALYHVWKNNALQGAMELPALVTEIKQGRILPNTWIYSEPAGRWQPANEVDELRMFFRATVPGPGATNSPSTSGLRPGALRRIRLFADMDDSQLQVFLAYTEMIHLRQFTVVVRKGEHSDAMYLVLEGELRARNIIDGKETTLATFAAGDFFGEISLLDHGPRSADVVANLDSTVLRISSEAIQKILHDAPAAAAPFLHSLSRSVAGRIRNLTRRYEDSIHFSRMGSMINS